MSTEIESAQEETERLAAKRVAGLRAVQARRAAEASGEIEGPGARALREEAQRARRAQAKVYGKAVAEAIEPWARYTLLEVDGEHFAFASQDECSAARRNLVGAGLDCGHPTAGIQGVAIIPAKYPKLASVDPDHDSLAELVSQHRAAREEQKRQREAREEVDRYRLKLENERRTYGVTISD